MERLNRELLVGLAADEPVCLVGPKGSGAFVPSEVQVREVSASPLPIFIVSALCSAVALAMRTRPRLVLAGSGLAAPLAWIAARCSGAGYGVYLHGLDLVVGSKSYQLLWLPFIRRCDMAIVNSKNTRKLAVGKGVPADRVEVVNPGTNIPEEDRGARAYFRGRHGLGDRPVLLSVGRLTPRKGLAEFVRDVLPIIVRDVPDVVLVVIGHDANDALTTRTGRPSQLERLHGTAKAAGLSGTVHVLPPCSDEDLSAAYASADVHVFPVRNTPGDVEGFGMVAIEAAAHGLATVAYDVGGVADAVLQERSGTLVAEGDADAFARAVVAQLRQPLPEEGIRGVAEEFAWPVFHKRIREALRAA